jgi:hypothetical protein
MANASLGGGRSVLLAMALGVAGCADDSAVVERDGGDGARLELPMLPVSDVYLSAVASGITDASSGIVLDSTLVMALAPGYPDALDVRFAVPYWTSCGQLAGEPLYESLELLGAGSALQAELLGDGSGFSLRATGEGEGEVVLRGQYQASADELCAAQLGSGNVAVEARVRVSARRPMGFTLMALDCFEAEALVVATSSTTRITPGLLDDNGEQMFVSNASTEGQVSIVLEADAALTAPSESKGLEGLTYPASAGPVRVVPAIGEPIEIDVVDATSVTGFEVEFQIGAVGGGGLLVEDGTTHAGGWGRTSNRLAPIIRSTMIGSSALCGAPNPAWFELYSDTPEQCEVRPMQPGSVDLAQHPIDSSAYIKQDGQCALRLRAPDFNGGEGFEQSIATTLLNVEQMIDVP